MKYLFICFLFFIGFSANAQQLNEYYFGKGLAIDKGRGGYPNASASLEIGDTLNNKKGLIISRVKHRDSIQSPAFGMIIYDMSNDQFYFRDRFFWKSLASGGGGSPIKEEGSGSTVKSEGDSLRVDLGGQLKEDVTHIYLPVGRKTNQSTPAQSKTFVISNKPNTGGVGTDWGYWNELGNNSLLVLERHFDEADADTSDQQYNGIAKAFTRLKLDRYSTRFRYDNKPIKMQDMGISSAIQLYAPQDSAHLIPGPFGYSGSAGKFTQAYGDFYGHNIAIRPTIPGFPQSTVMAEIDFNRVNDDAYAKKMNGRISNYVAGWKQRQSAINSGTTETGHRTTYVSDVTSVGSFYPNIGAGTTKDKILRVSSVDTVVGVHLLPKYNLENETRTGVGIWQQGAEDVNQVDGFINFGGSLPIRPDGIARPQQRKARFNYDVSFGDTVTFNNEKLKLLSQNLGPTSNWNWLESTDSTYRLILGSRTGHMGTLQMYGSGSVATDNRGGFDFTAVDRAGITSQTNKVKHRFYIRDNSPGGTGAYVNYFQIAKDSTSMLIQANVNDTLAFTPLLINKSTGTLAKTPWSTIANMIGYGAEEKAFVDSLSTGLIADSTQQKLIVGLTGNYDTVYTYYKVYPATSWDSTRAFLIPKYQNTGLITAGSNVTLTGTGTPGNPFVISATGGGSAIAVGTTTVSSGTSGRVLYDNAGVVGEKPVTGSGDVVLATSPAFAGTPTSPNLTWSTVSTGIVNGNTARDMIFNYAVKPVSGTGGATNLTPTGDAFYENYAISALSTNIVGISAPSGSNQFQGNSILFALDDNGTARSISGWNATYRAGDIAFPTTTVVGKVMYIQFVKHVSGSWDLVGLTYINK
jgi:hypothetical protein